MTTLAMLPLHWNGCSIASMRPNRQDPYLRALLDIWRAQAFAAVFADAGRIGRSCP
jgi:hypothetical protein